MPLRWYLLVFFAAFNYFSYKFFRLDAHRAFRGQKRIPNLMLELDLLLGGEVGALVALTKYGTKKRQKYILFTAILMLILHLLFLSMYVYAAFKSDVKLSEMTVRSVISFVSKFISTL